MQKYYISIYVPILYHKYILIYFLADNDEPEMIEIAPNIFVENIQAASSKQSTYLNIYIFFLFLYKTFKLFR